MIEHTVAFGRPTIEQLTDYARDIFETDDVRLSSLAGGHHNTNFRVIVGPDAAGGEFVLRYPRNGDCSGIEREFGNLGQLDECLVPKPIRCEHLPALGVHVMLMEFIDGVHRDFNDLDDDGVHELAGVLTRLHAVKSRQYSPGAGMPPTLSGTYRDYITAMLDESVTIRLRSLDLDCDEFRPAKKALQAAWLLLNEFLKDKKELFGESDFSMLHHDLNPYNVLWLPNGGIRLIDLQNVMFGDAADDFDYVSTNNNGTPKFTRTLTERYCALTGCHKVVQRAPAYTWKNRMDHVAWAMTMERMYPGNYQEIYQQGLCDLQATLR